MRTLDFEMKLVSPRSGEFTGLASVYGVADLVGDTVERGAFTKDLQERGAERPLLFNHMPPWIIGKATLTDSPQGLLVRGKLTDKTQTARDAAGLLAEGLLTGISIGYDVLKQKYEAGTRRLLEMRLFEVSLVTFPAQPLATVTSKAAAAAAAADMRASVAEIRALVMQPRPSSNDTQALHTMREQLADIRSFVRRQRER